MFYTHRRLSAAVDILEFYRVASRLKGVRRAGWVRKIPSVDVESVADHSLMAAMLSLVLAEDAGLDAHRCAAMAVVHDLAESVVGDLLPDEVPQDEKHARERAAIDSIAESLGGSDVLLSLYSEYDAGTSDEARLVHQVDKLEMALQAISYYMDGILARDDACEFVEGALRYISDRALIEHIRGALRSSGLVCIHVDMTG
jgi:putative hydrolase of HD superfamily